MLIQRREPLAEAAAEAQVARFSPHGLSLSEWRALLGNSLSSNELRGLESMQQLRWLNSGEPAFSRAQRAGDLVAVISGTVGLGQRREDGSFDLQRNVQGPQWLDLSSAWLGGGYGQDAQALGRARVLVLPVAAVRDLLLRETALGERLLAGLAQTVRHLARMSYDLVYKDAEHRLADWLLRRCVADGDELLVPMSERKADVAAQLGITPETFSRTLKALRVKGVIEVSGYTIKVLNLPALQGQQQQEPRPEPAMPAH